MGEIATIPARRVSVVQYEVSDIERMARAISASKLFGMSSPEQALALCLIAQSEGRHPASAAQDYHIIQGKPSKKSDAMLRDFLSAGGKVEWHALDDTTADATFSHPAGGSARITWDMARAKKAQLSTPMWTKYPRQMLRSRVVSEGVRTVFPMATSGMYVPEEVQDFDPETKTKSSHQLKQEGGDDVFKSICQQVREAQSVADLQAIRKEHSYTIETWPVGSEGKPGWRDSFEQEIYEPRLAELREIAKHKPRTKAADALTAEESATVRAGLLLGLHACADASEIAEWRDANVTAFRSMSNADQRLVADERDARLAEMFDREQTEGEG